jgi:hypothetical protein
MGFLRRSEQAAKVPLHLPAGCFTMDGVGAIVATTMPSDFPKTLMAAIGDAVLKTLRGAELAGLGLSELSVHYGSVRICARDLHGGTLVFLNPQYVSTTSDS